MKKDIESLKNDRRKEIASEYDKNYLLKSNFDDREIRIFEYIKDNPGCNKQSIIDHFAEITGFSRNPIFKMIKNLIERKYINEKRDHHNKNTRKLFVNERNVILLVSNEMETFRNDFLELLKSTNLANIKNDDHKEILKVIDDYYREFIDICIHRSLPTFRKMINDEQILHKLDDIILNNIRLLHIKYCEFDNPISYLEAPPEVEKCTDDDDYDQKIQLFKSKGMQDQITTLLEQFHRINYRYAKQDRVLG
jgi:DNA-binding MarR family transcriptional regulator